MIQRSKEVGAYEAKNNFGLLLDRVVRGDEIVITRHGQPVARLVPYRVPVDREKVRRAIASLRRARKGSSLGGLKIKDLIDEGRR